MKKKFILISSMIMTIFLVSTSILASSANKKLSEGEYKLYVRSLMGQAQMVYDMIGKEKKAVTETKKEMEMLTVIYSDLTNLTPPNKYVKLHKKLKPRAIKYANLYKSMAEFYALSDDKEALNDKEGKKFKEKMTAMYKNLEESANDKSTDFDDAIKEILSSK
jgi:hypothetical protein